MLLNTLLQKIAKHVECNPQDAGAQTLATLAKAEDKNIEEFLLGYDIRDIGRIRNISPNSFPKVLRQGSLVAELNIHGAWRVVPFMKNGKTFALDKVSTGKAILLCHPKSCGRAWNPRTKRLNKS